MIVDTSALVAILMLEPEAVRFARSVASSPVARMSAAGYVEAGMVVDRKGTASARSLLDDFIAEHSILIEPVTADQARAARRAYDLFGKGRHPAALNFGDCFSYALAKAYREPILYKGVDFSKTDLLPADR